MQITKELLDQHVAGMEAQLENAKALVAKTAGALEVFKGMLKYLELPDPVPEPDISEVNAKVQDEQAVKQAEVLQSVVNAQGKYEEKLA